MSPQARTGLLAAGIVVGLFLVGGCVVGGIILARQGRDAGAGAGVKSGHSTGTTGAAESTPGRREPPPVDPPTTKDHADPNFQAILAHRYFSKRPSVADVEEVIAYVLTGSRTHSVYWSAANQRARLDWPDGPDWEGFRPDAPGVGRPFVRIDLDRFRTRPTREEAVRIIRGSLDRADFNRRDWLCPDNCRKSRLLFRFGQFYFGSPAPSGRVTSPASNPDGDR